MIRGGDRAMICFAKKTLLLAILLLAYSVQGQKVADCPRRNIIVNVRDKQGKLVSGLQPTSFHGLLSGRPVRIVSETVKREAPRIVLLLDLSGSVNRSNHNLDTAQLIASNFVATSGIRRIALVLFSDHIIEALGFDREPNEALQRLTKLNDGQGRTALLDSLMYSANLFQTPESGDAIYVISDGGDNYSKLNEKDVEGELVSRGIRLFSFVLAQPQVFLHTEEERLQEYSYLQPLGWSYWRRAHG